ncbi:hypothetical protein LSH36_327g03023 [Paralvinella palmiformis]|uniref:Uncharacterized protein n=1 Tax=Paralvinella palmiformis TaxID=53620 RepID=A0AAD9N0Q7_9ANNE|nr:hypothetical protein LSH36_327g03023 [Paralvinella palmiformis]
MGLHSVSRWLQRLVVQRISVTFGATTRMFVDC